MKTGLIILLSVLVEKIDSPIGDENWYILLQADCNLSVEKIDSPIGDENLKLFFRSVSDVQKSRENRFPDRGREHMNRF